MAAVSRCVDQPPVDGLPGLSFCLIRGGPKNFSDSNRRSHAFYPRQLHLGDTTYHVGVDCDNPVLRWPSTSARIGLQMDVPFKSISMRQMEEAFARALSALACVFR